MPTTTHDTGNVLKTTSENIYWRTAIYSGKKIVDMGHLWTADGAVCFWHGYEANQAQNGLTRVAVPANA